jgi:hypothetical protein
MDGSSTIAGMLSVPPGDEVVILEPFYENKVHLPQGGGRRSIVRSLTADPFNVDPRRSL